jgi:hypothetical protein
VMPPDFTTYPARRSHPAGISARQR